MQLRVHLDRGDDLFVGAVVPMKRPRGVLSLVTPELQLPSGMPIRVTIMYDPTVDQGRIDVTSAGTDVAHVAPITGRYFQFSIRLATDEVLGVVISST